MRQQIRAPDIDIGYRKIAERIFFRGMSEQELLKMADYLNGNWAIFKAAVARAKANEERKPPLTDVEERIVDEIWGIVIPKAEICGAVND